MLAAETPSVRSTPNRYLLEIGLKGGVPPRGAKAKARRGKRRGEDVWPLLRRPLTPRTAPLERLGSRPRPRSTTTSATHVPQCRPKVTARSGRSVRFQRVVMRDEGESEFTKDTEPPGDAWVQVLCEDHRGTYVLPFASRYADGSWRNPITGKLIEAQVLGWRQRRKPSRRDATSSSPFLRSRRSTPR